MLRSDIRLTPSDIALRAAIGEFNIAFCDSRKYRNPEGIISHFALAKYFTDHFLHHPKGWSFLAPFADLYQRITICNPPFYRLSVASEWQRSVCNVAAPSARHTQGTATVHSLQHILYRCIVRAVTIGSSLTDKPPKSHRIRWLFGGVLGALH